jgi:site-specific recombinase XerD
MTVGQAVSEFFDYLKKQEQSKGVLTEFSGVVRRYFLWRVFCLLPTGAYQIGYMPEQVLAGKPALTAGEYRRYWRRFHSFLESAPVKYLTMGDAVRGFLNTLEDAGYAEQSILDARSRIKQLGRDFAERLPLSTIDGRIIMAIWQNKGSNYQRLALARFLRYLQKEGHISCRPCPRYELKWKRELKELTKTADTKLGPDSLLDDCLGPHLLYCMDAKNLAEAGLKKQYENLKSFSRWLGPCSIISINLDRVEKFLVYLQEERRNSLASLKSMAVTLKTFFSYLSEDGILSENPLASLRVKQPQTFSRNVLTEEELGRLLTAARAFDRKCSAGFTERIKRFMAARDLAIVEVLAHTGIRSGELRALTLEQVDLERGCLEITGKGSVKYYKKERRAYLEFDQTRQALADYLAVRPPEFGRLLFVTRNGNPLLVGDVNKILQRFARAAGINKHVSCHDLRATFASILVANGADPLTLKTLMGHEDLSTTMKSYVTLEREQLRSVWKKCNPLANLPSWRGDDQK